MRRPISSADDIFYGGSYFSESPFPSSGLAGSLIDHVTRETQNGWVWKSGRSDGLSKRQCGTAKQLDSGLEWHLVLCTNEAWVWICVSCLFFF